MMIAIKKTLFTSAAILALTACGKGDKGATPGPSAKKAADIEAASPLDRDFRLSGGEPVDADALLAFFPARSRPTYDSADFEDDIGATVLTNLRFADANDGEAVVVERAEFFGVDLDAIERVKTAESGNFETVFEKVRLINIASEGFDDEDAQIDLTIAGVELDKLQIKPGVLNGDKDPGFAVFDAVALGGAYAKDFSMVSSQEGVADVKFSAPDLRLVGMGGGKISAILASDLSYEITQGEETLAQIDDALNSSGAGALAPFKGLFAPENQQMKLGAFAWRDIDFSKALDWAIREERPPVSEKKLIDLGSISMSNAQSFVNGKRASVIEEATIAPMEFTWLVPSNIRADVKGSVYDYTAFVPEGETELLSVLTSHGLDNIAGEGFTQWRWNEKSGVASLVQEATTNGFADLLVNMELSGFEIETVEALFDDPENMTLLANAALNGMEISVADEKALDAIFDVAALQMGGSGEDLRLSVPAMVRLSGLQASQFNPRISGYIDAVADFVAKGGSLNIAAKPDEAVPFSAMQTVDPTTIPDVINLTVTHTPE